MLFRSVDKPAPARGRVSRSQNARGENVPARTTIDRADCSFWRRRRWSAEVVIGEVGERWSRREGADREGRARVSDESAPLDVTWSVYYKDLRRSSYA